VGRFKVFATSASQIIICLGLVEIVQPIYPDDIDAYAIAAVSKWFTSESRETCSVTEKLNGTVNMCLKA
jgi:hypothetical protein